MFRAKSFFTISLINLIVEQIIRKLPVQLASRSDLKKFRNVVDRTKENDRNEIEEKFPAMNDDFERVAESEKSLKTNEE